MPYPRRRTFVLGVAGALFVSGGGCSSGGGSTTPPVDANLTGNGTVGQPCVTDADCGLVAPGLTGRCSAGAFELGPLLPTPVCVAGGCTIADPTQVAYCDGTAGTGSATPGAAPLGLCLNAGATNLCLPLCTFDGASGAAPQGCLGKDACVAQGFGTSTGDGGASVAYGVGYCFGGCAQDADCPTGSACQIEDGLCVGTKTTYSLSPGAPCTETQGGTAGGCNCEFDSSSGAGYCTLACVQGGAACPSGYVCDSLLPTTLAEEGGAAPGFSRAPAGLSGVCLLACETPVNSPDASTDASTDAATDAAVDGSVDASADASTEAGACPPSSTCRGGGLVGDDCQP